MWVSKGFVSDHDEVRTISNCINELEREVVDIFIHIEHVSVFQHVVLEGCEFRIASKNVYSGLNIHWGIPLIVGSLYVMFPTRKEKPRAHVI